MTQNIKIKGCSTVKFNFSTCKIQNRDILNCLLGFEIWFKFKQFLFNFNFHHTKHSFNIYSTLDIFSERLFSFRVHFDTVSFIRFRKTHSLTKKESDKMIEENNRRLRDFLKTLPKSDKN